MRAPDKAGPIFVLQSNYRSLPSLNLPRAPQRDWIPPRAWRQFSCHTSPASPPRQRPLLGSHRDPCAAELPAHLPRWHPRERGRGPHLGPRFGVGSGVLPRASLSPQQDLGSSPVKPHPYGTFSLGGSGPSCHPRGPLAIPGHLSFSWAHLGSPGPLSSHTSGGAAWLGWHHARPLPVPRAHRRTCSIAHTTEEEIRDGVCGSTFHPAAVGLLFPLPARSRLRGELWGAFGTPWSSQNPC